MRRIEKRLFPLKRLCFEAHQGIVHILCGKKTTGQERRAIMVIEERVIRYLHSFEPEIARWERDKK